MTFQRRFLSFLLSSVALASVAIVSTPFTASAFAGGTGVSGDPYQISTCAHLLEIDDTTSNLSKEYVLTGNIDCTGVTFTPLVNGSTVFTGTLDGDGHSISGFTLTCSVDYCGLFKDINGATIKNLRFISPSVSTTAKYVGLLSSRAYNAILIDDITIVGGSVTNSFVGSDTSHEVFTYTGGLIGYYIASTAVNGAISNIDSSLTVNGKSMTGGLVAEARSAATLTLTDVNVSGNVSGLSYVGGLVGRGMDSASQLNNGLTIIRGSVTSTSVSGTGQKIGGILGFGWNVTIRESSSSADVSGRAAGAGVGISASTALGAKVGGIAGELSGGTSRIEDSVSTGDVVASGTDGPTVADDVGGILGWARLTTLYLTRVAHVGLVSGATRVGGLVGNQTSIVYVEDSYSRSQMAGFTTADLYGGMFGSVSNTAQIRRSYFAGTQNDVVAANRYSVVKTDSSSRVTCTGFFFDSENLGSGKTSSTSGRCGGNDGTASKTTADMQTSATFTAASWNFTSGSAIWTITAGTNANYPYHSSAGLDVTPPTVTITSPSSPSASRTLSFSLVFSESINGLAAGDFSNTGTASGCAFTPASSSGTSVTVSVACTSDGTVVLRLSANSVTDTASNTGPTSATSSSSVVINTVVATTTTTTVAPTTTNAPATTTAPTVTVAPTGTTAPLPTTSPATTNPGNVAPTATTPTVQATPTTLPTTTTTVASTTTTTLPAVDVPELADGGGALVVDGQRIEATITREDNQLVIAAGVLRARISAVKREGGRAPLDSQGRIRMDQGDSVEIEVTGFGAQSQVEVRMYSDPVLLGRSTVSSIGNLMASYEVPNSIEDGRHTVVLLGESQAGDDLTFALAVFVGDESTGPSTLALLVGIPLGLAVIGALIIPAIIRRRRDEEPAI